MNFYISDLHLGHKNILSLDERNFETLEDMHATIINNWNSVVKDTDTVYIIGDLAWKNAVGIDVLNRLTGNKVLILGNHDKINNEIRKAFIEVTNTKIITDSENGITQQLILSHYPIAHWYNQFKGSILIYGHVHIGIDWSTFEFYGNYCRMNGIPFEAYNVGCMLDYMNFTPRTLEEIKAGYKTSKLVSNLHICEH